MKKRLILPLLFLPLLPSFSLLTSCQDKKPETLKDEALKKILELDKDPMHKILHYWKFSRTNTYFSIEKYLEEGSIPDSDVTLGNNTCANIVKLISSGGEHGFNITSFNPDKMYKDLIGLAKPEGGLANSPIPSNDERWEKLKKIINLFAVKILGSISRIKDAALEFIWQLPNLIPTGYMQIDFLKLSSYIEDTTFISVLLQHTNRLIGPSHKIEVDDDLEKIYDYSLEPDGVLYDANLFYVNDFYELEKALYFTVAEILANSSLRQLCLSVIDKLVNLIGVGTITSGTALGDLTDASYWIGDYQNILLGSGIEPTITTASKIYEFIADADVNFPNLFTKNSVWYEFYNKLIYMINDEKEKYTQANPPPSIDPNPVDVDIPEETEE